MNTEIQFSTSTRDGEVSGKVLLIPSQRTLFGSGGVQGPGGEPLNWYFWSNGGTWKLDIGRGDEGILWMEEGRGGFNLPESGVHVQDRLFWYLRSRA